MKGYRALQIVLYALLAVAVVACLILSQVGCASSADQTFQAPRVQPVPFPVPVPPAELSCDLPPELAVKSLSLSDVESDGSIIIQALTSDVLVLLEDAMTRYNQCVASNEARQIVIEAAQAAQAELERLLAEIDE